VEWNLTDAKGNKQKIQTLAYYVPSASIRLLSPQHMFSTADTTNKDGYCVIRKNMAKMVFSKGPDLVFPIDSATNLPLLLHTPHKPPIYLSMPVCSTRQIRLSLADERNNNLTAGQKECLAWHWRLGHIGFQLIQAVMYHESAKHQSSVMPNLIRVKFKRTSTCKAPTCASCQLAKMRRTNRGQTTQNPGDCISMDQFVCAQPGRLPHTKGKEKTEDKFHGGTIFVDHSSGFIFVHNQVSLRSGETLVGKQLFETLAHDSGITFKNSTLTTGFLLPKLLNETCEGRNKQSHFPA
jgi:hypothetical protein